MTPLYYAISVVMVAFHKLASQVFAPDSGAAWVISIVGLTLVIRAALIPLFVKQIKSTRNMQELQPKVKELQKKYGHDREKLAQETMELYREAGTNPLASCLPLIIQMPIFLALFRLLDHAADGKAKGIMSVEQAEQFASAELFGHIPIKLTLINNDGNLWVIIAAVALVLAMTATTFLTQRQLMTKNMSKQALEGPMAQQQKILLYVLPLVFGIGGIAFPIAVLIYWTTSNLWTMGQQFYVIRNNPTPGTPAAEAKVKRDAEKRARKGLAPLEGDVVAGTVVLEKDDERRPAQRQQPKNQPRSQRTGGQKSPNKKKR
ncbi:membrane protein insertase YidC [Nocardioides yefusunii]|uniref:Membrane protein insertase YidC n=1 Tax=Nocardioides yefusunii TaxID=2500546 RepID=A0ABW1R057_9ACTN